MANWTTYKHNIKLLQGVSFTGDAGENIINNFRAIADALDSAGGGAVTSVAGRTGDVVLAESDIANLTSDLAAKASASTVSAHIAATNAHGTTGTVVGTSDTQTLTNKTISGATVSGTTTVNGPVSARINDCFNNALTIRTPAAKAGSITLRAITSNVATLTTSVTHSVVVGEQVTVNNLDGTFNGIYTVTAVTSNTFSYAKVHADVAPTASNGSYLVTQQGKLASFKDVNGTERVSVDSTGTLTVYNLSGTTISGTTFGGITQNMVVGLRTIDQPMFSGLSLGNGTAGGNIYGNNNVGTGGGTWTTDGGDIVLKAGNLYTQQTLFHPATAARATITFNTGESTIRTGTLSFTNLRGAGDSINVTFSASGTTGTISDDQGSATQNYTVGCYATVTFTSTLNDGDSITFFTESHPVSSGGITATYAGGQITDPDSHVFSFDNTDTNTAAASFAAYLQTFFAFDFSVSASSNTVTVIVINSGDAATEGAWSSSTGAISCNGMNYTTIAGMANDLIAFFQGSSVYSNFGASFDGTSVITLTLVTAGVAGNTVGISNGSTDPDSSISTSGFFGGEDAFTSYQDQKIIDGTVGQLTFPLTSAAPNNPNSQVGWIPIMVNGVQSFIPYYQ